MNGMKMGAGIASAQIISAIFLVILLGLNGVLSSSALATSVEEAAHAGTMSGLTSYIFTLLNAGWLLVVLIIAIGGPVGLGAVWAMGHQIAAGVFGMIALLIAITLAGIINGEVRTAQAQIGSGGVGDAYITAANGSCSNPSAAPTAAATGKLCIGTTTIGTVTSLTGNVTINGRAVTSSDGGLANAKKVFTDLTIARTILQFVPVLYALGILTQLLMSLTALGMAGVSAIRSGGEGGMMAYGKRR